MTDSGTLLLLHGGDPRVGVVAHRLRRLGYRSVGAKSPEEAFRLGGERQLRFRAILVPASLPAADLSSALEEMRARLADGPLGCLAVGPRPEPEIRRQLRAAGVDLAAFEPCEDSTLRFQLNRAMAGPVQDVERIETRVPTDLSARVQAAGRSKSAMVRTLSATGAFLETLRPSLPGVSVRLELSLPPQTVQAAGQVVYANVPGNLMRRGLPTGMAVRFTELSENAERAIRHCVAERALTLVV
ncbi:MAG: PilZ domain-containing protein [Myxococcota bacterium]